MRWDDDAETDSSLAVCAKEKELVTSMDLNDQTIEEVRHSLNVAGEYYLFKEKVEEGGNLLKYALKLSDDRGIVLNENVSVFGIRNG